MWVCSVLIAWNDSESGWELILVLPALGGLLIGIACAGGGGGAFLAASLGAAITMGAVTSMWDVSPVVVALPFVGLAAGRLAGARMRSRSTETRSRR
jgi:hypothetical protein